jgi:hypothetical protein
VESPEDSEASDEFEQGKGGAMSAMRVGAEVPIKAAKVGDERGGVPPRPAPTEVGGGAGGGGGASAGGTGGSELQETINKVVKWIPGDALAVYAAAVTAFAAKSGARPSIVLLIVGIVLAAALVPLGAFAAKGSIPGKSLLPAALAAFAFAIWSLSVPFSGWQRWHVVHENQAEVAIVAAVLALLFGLVAEGLSKKYGGSS